MQSDSPAPPYVPMPHGSSRQPRNETEQRIIDAAHAVMTAHGLAGATTKRIAKQAGVAEGSIYRYFERKEDLFLEVLWRIPSDFVRLMAQLPQRVNVASVRGTLTEIAIEALLYFSEVISLGASVFAEPALRREYAGSMRERGIGPHMPNQSLTKYIQAEIDSGRISDKVDPAGMSYALLGACFQRAYQSAFFDGTFTDVERHEIATGIVTALALPE